MCVITLADIQLSTSGRGPIPILDSTAVIYAAMTHNLYMYIKKKKIELCQMNDALEMQHKIYHCEDKLATKNDLVIKQTQPFQSSIVGRVRMDQRN